MEILLDGFLVFVLSLRDVLQLDFRIRTTARLDVDVGVRTGVQLQFAGVRVKTRAIESLLDELLVQVVELLLYGFVGIQIDHALLGHQVDFRVVHEHRHLLGRRCRSGGHGVDSLLQPLRPRPTRRRQEQKGE